MYKHILAAVDLSDASDHVISRAKELATTFGARLTLLHVVEYVPVEPMGEALMPAMDIEADLVACAERNLENLARRHDLLQIPRSVQAGSIKAEILRLAMEQDVDLVALGSPERHGLAILFNATEDTVLHAAPCDVLAIRVQ
jgi:universal stress protein A